MSVIDSLLDRTILYPFDRRRFLRHARRFRSADLDVDLAGRIGLGPAAGVISMARSRWSLRAAKSDRLLVTGARA
jgi:hypothetical protein